MVEGGGRGENCKFRRRNCSGGNGRLGPSTAHRSGKVWCVGVQVGRSADSQGRVGRVKGSSGGPELSIPGASSKIRTRKRSRTLREFFIRPAAGR